MTYELLNNIRLQHFALFWEVRYINWCVKYICKQKNNIISKSSMISHRNSLTSKTYTIRHENSIKSKAETKIS